MRGWEKLQWSSVLSVGWGRNTCRSRFAIRAGAWKEIDVFILFSIYWNMSDKIANFSQLRPSSKDSLLSPCNWGFKLNAPILLFWWMVFFNCILNRLRLTFRLLVACYRFCLMHLIYARYFYWVWCDLYNAIGGAESVVSCPLRCITKLIIAVTVSAVRWTGNTLVAPPSFTNCLILCFKLWLTAMHIVWCHLYCIGI